MIILGDWTVIVSAVSSVFSAAAALAATIIAKRAYSQSRKDKLEEIEANRPKFKITSAKAPLITSLGDEFSIDPFFQLNLVFKKYNRNAASSINLRGEIFQVKSLNERVEFTRQPLEERDENDVFDVTFDMPTLAPSDDPYYLRLYLEYMDSRTGQKFQQFFHRKFYLQGEPNSLTIQELDRPEFKSLRAIESKHWNKEMKLAHKQMKQLTGRDKEDS